MNEEKKVRLGITISKRTSENLDKESKKLGLNKSQFLSFLINKYAENQKMKGA